MSDIIIFWGSVAIAIVVLFLLVVLIMGKLYRKVEQGRAMIINAMRTTKVTFSGGIVIPVFHKLEIMDISLKTIEVDRSGSDGLICKDNIRADIKVGFFVKVNKNSDDVLKVAQAIGCERASNIATLEDLFLSLIHI